MKSSNILWGLVLILIGIIFGLNALDIADINIFFDGWWTLFIIVPCFIDLFKDKDKSGNIIGLIIGICLLLGCQNIIDFDLIWKLMLPFILIMIGLSFIFKDVFKNKNNKVINKKGMKEYCTTFGGQKVNYSKEKFEGCNLTAVFGGIECDLRDAIINGDVVINSSAIFGGITIFVPEGVKVVINSTPIFGGISNDIKNKNIDAKNTLYINATSIFGGVEVK